MPGNMNKKVDYLQQRLDYFHSLVEASKRINSSLELDELLESIINIAVEKTHAEAGTIYLIDSAKGEIWSKISATGKKIEIRLKMGQGIAGHVAQMGETININSAHSHPNFECHFDTHTGFITKSMLCMPMKNVHSKTIGVFQIMNSKHDRFSSFDEDFIDGLSSHASIAIEKAELYAQALEKKAMEHEMELAGKIQTALLPKLIPQINGFDLYAKSIPAKFVGGDYFDFILTDQNILRFCIADVCGKGVPAALLMASLRTAVHISATNNTADSIIIFAKEINRVIFDSTPSSSFITFFYGELEIQTGKILFVNAGHNPPVLIEKESNLKEINKHNLALGLKKDAVFDVGELYLYENEIFCLFTDGITEAMNLKEEHYGENRFYNTLAEKTAKSAREMFNFIFDDIDKFQNTSEQYDDITMMIIKRN